MFSKCDKLNSPLAPCWGGLAHITLLLSVGNRVQLFTVCVSVLTVDIFQLSERSTDIDLVREAVHQKRSLRASAQGPSSSVRRTSSRHSSRAASVNTSTDELDRISVVEKRDQTELGRVKTIQSRPLPQLPPSSSTPAQESTQTDNTKDTDLNLSLPKLQMR